MKFLIVEQNEGINHNISVLLSEYKGGSTCESAYDLDRGLDMAMVGKYDMIVIGCNGVKTAVKNLITKVRVDNSVPIVVLSNDKDLEVKIDLLNSGADSYMPYDFDSNEFLAVINSVLRRYYCNFGTNIYEFKNLQINFFERSVKIDGEQMNIVAKMYEVFEYMVRHKEIIKKKNTLCFTLN